MKITVETVVHAKLNKVWDVWNNPADIKQWNTAQDDWHTTRCTVDLREGGKFLARMEARDGSEGFDFEGTYTRIVPNKAIEYRMSDGREVKVEFIEGAGGVLVKETFDAETENTPELQRTGWQAILDRFGRHVEAKGNKESLPIGRPPVVSAQEWEASRQQLLVKEKALTRARDALAAERRRMPWQAVEKSYGFDGPNGKASLLDLFESRRQLIVYRAFFEPGVYGWPEHACRGCSFLADQVAHVAHLNARDTTLAFVSRAPQADIERLKARMDWKMPWYTITDSFDTDFGVHEWHGTNAFIHDGDHVFRTYFVNNRGDEAMGSTWNYLDITALGRQEEWEDSPEGYPQTPPYKWWNWHDEYDNTPSSQWSKVVDRSLDLQGQEVGRNAGG